MGANQSAIANHDNVNKKYTENEIRNNINKLFLNNKNNDINETSVGTLGNFDGLTTEPNPSWNLPQLGGGIQQRRNRYQKYELEPFVNNLIQSGGQTKTEESDSYRAISDISEFKRLRDYLKTDPSSNKILSSNQLGGGINDSINYSFNTPMSQSEKKFNIFDILKGGAERTPDSDLSDLDNDTSDMTDSDDEEVDISEEIVLDSNDDNNDFSETSLSSRSSDINILPFYSTSDSSTNSFKHPYVKNRF